MKKVITISREFGSGGRFIGEEAAKKLGIAYYDNNFINEIAEKTGASTATISRVNRPLNYGNDAYDMVFERIGLGEAKEEKAE